MANQAVWSVGLETLTAISRKPTIGVVGAAEAQVSLGGLSVCHGSALAGVPNLANMAGGERYVQRATLKSFGLSRGRFLAPGYRSATGIGNGRDIPTFPPP